MNIIFEIKVFLDEIFEVSNEFNKIIMINFHGDCTSDFFEGKILPGAVDTQKIIKNSHPLLSARYILSGKDKKGIPTNIFIENNGTFDDSANELLTTPFIVTDNNNLKWLEEKQLVGKIQQVDDCLKIVFYEGLNTK